MADSITYSTDPWKVRVDATLYRDTVKDSVQEEFCHSYFLTDQ